MKKLIPIICMIISVALLASCANSSQVTNGDAATPNSEVTEILGKYADSEYTGVWYNADSAEEKIEFELLADGTAKFREESTGTWEPTDAGLTVKVTVDGKEQTLTGYFVIAGDGFVARYNEENQHYIDDGEGVKQLEFMLTENTCVDCVQK